MLRCLLFILLALLAPAALAQDKPLPTLAGSWALEVGGTAMFRFDLIPAGDGWTGTWWRPKSFASDGNSFSRVTGPAVQVAGEGKASGEWAEITFPDTRPGAVPDVFRFRLIGSQRAEMIYVDTKLAPYTLVRVTPETPIGPWKAEQVYRRLSVETLGLPPDPQALHPLAAGEAPLDEPLPAPVSKDPEPSFTLPPGAKPIEGR